MQISRKPCQLFQAIDGKKETIRVTDSSNIKVSGLAEKMPEGAPRFNLYRYSHVKDGKSTQFIPGNKVTLQLFFR